MKKPEDKIRDYPRSKIDKIGSAIVFVGTIALYILDKSQSFLTTIGWQELIPIIPFVSALSLFCFIWSFIWENKIRCLNSNIQNQEECFSNKLNENIIDLNKTFEELKVYVKGSLSKPHYTEYRLLKEHESNLTEFLSLNSAKNECAQISIVTNDADVENEDFGNIIIQNILQNHYYIYITPFEQDMFLQKMHQTLFDNIPNNVDKECLEVAFKKRIKHIQNKEFFKLLPEYSDMVVYAKKQRNKWNQRPNEVKGYYSFQNDKLEIDGNDYYFYSEMTKELAVKIADYIKPSPITFEDSYIDSVEKRNSQYGGIGLFCKKVIPKGETILTVEGFIIGKDQLDTNSLESIHYLQISKKYVLSSDFPINHSCKKPNCGIRNYFEIIATRNIEVGEEILIDYAYFDPDYQRFDCKGCTKNCSRYSLSPDKVLENIVKTKKDYISPYLTH